MGFLKALFGAAPVVIAPSAQALPVHQAPIVSLARQQQEAPRDEIDQAVEEMKILRASGYTERYALVCAATKLIAQNPSWARKIPMSVRSWVRRFKREEQLRMYDWQAADRLSERERV